MGKEEEVEEQKDCEYSNLSGTSSFHISIIEILINELAEDLCNPP